MESLTRNSSVEKVRIRQTEAGKIPKKAGILRSDFFLPVTGDAATLRRIVEMFAKSKPASVVYCMGITQHNTGVDNVKDLANLAMLNGNVGVASGGVNPLRGQNNVQGACPTSSRATSPWPTKPPIKNFRGLGPSPLQ